MRFPRFCACCMRDAETEIPLLYTRTKGVKVIRSKSITWPLPYCHTCISHINAWHRSSRNFKLALFSGLAFSCIFLFAGLLNTALTLSILSLLLALVARYKTRQNALALCTKECPTVHVAASYDGWSGSVHSFDFAHRNYAARFMQMNVNKLVNLNSEARAILESCLQDSTFANPKTEGLFLGSERNNKSDEDAGELFFQCVSKIERAKGPASRRAALDAGLQKLTDTELRRRLKVEATRIEVSTGLERMEKLKSRSSRARLLSSLRGYLSDETLPHDFRDEQIRWITETVMELEERERAGAA